MAVRSRLEIAERRKVPAQPPVSRLAYRNAGGGIYPPVGGLSGVNRFTPAERRKQLRWIAEPVIPGRARLGHGTAQPIPPFDQRNLFPREERRRQGAVRVAVIPRLAPHLDFPVKSRGAPEPFVHLARDFALRGDQRPARLPAELPSEEMVIQRLLAVAAVLRELGEDFALPQLLQLVKRRRPTRQFRPAGNRHNQSHQFAYQMIVRG